MQVQDEEKKKRIMQAAGNLFASKQFHKVCLEDVAAKAGVGKGTLYTYFQSKEDIYLSLLEDALGTLVKSLEKELGQSGRTSDQNLQLIIQELVDYAASHPNMFELMRSCGASLDRPLWNKNRSKLNKLIEQVLINGTKRGELNDPNPQLTALFMPGLVRSAMWFKTIPNKPTEKKQLTEQILRFVKGGVRCQD